MERVLKGPNANQETSYDLASEILGCHFDLNLLLSQTFKEMEGIDKWGWTFMYRKGKN